jgi:hypothetical protein
MLLLGTNTISVDDVTVFPDHADQNQFWYLPAPVGFGKDANGEPAFTFIKYKPGAQSAGAKGGGFLMLDAILTLDPATQGKVLAAISSLAPANPILTAVPFDSGTVQCVALNLQGSGGTVAPPTPGTFNAVEKILGATNPSLFGNNDATFSLTLDQDGATILGQAFEDGSTPIGVIYTLKFTGLRPALAVTITADLSRVYDEFSASLTATIYYVKLGIDAAFEKLKQDGAIKIDVKNFSTSTDRDQQEQWALDFFKQSILANWFNPTLKPGQISSAADGVAAAVTKNVDTAPVSFKLRYVHQEELKTVTVEFNQSQAVQQMYCPQGLLGLLVAKLDRSKHFVEVDLDSPFFRRFQVAVDAPIDFQKYGLLSGHAALDYGNPTDRADVKHGEYIFDTSNRQTKFLWDVSMDEFNTAYNYTLDYHFDPNVGWQANGDFYQLATVTTENRQLSLDPTQTIGFLEVKLLPHQIDSSVVTAIDVALTYKGANGDNLSQSINITPDSAVQFWRARVVDPAVRSYSYSLLHHLKTGQDIQGDTITTQATSIAVNDPFKASIDIEFIPLIDPTKTVMVLVDVLYDDPNNQYHREEQLTLTPSPGRQPVPLKLSILDPALTTFSYRFTFIDKGNQLHRGAYLQSTETIIGVSET